MLKEEIKIDCPKVSQKLISFIKEKTEELKREGIVFGLSGGIDSAVLAFLSVRAVGKDKVLAMVLPEKDSSSETVKDARLIAKESGSKIEIKNISSQIKTFGSYHLLPLRFVPKRGRAKTVRYFYEYYQKKTEKLPFEAGLLGSKDLPFSSWLNKSNAFYRIKHRLRMVNLYYSAELKNLLVACAANKTEWRVGFFVKGGCDDIGDIGPLLPLYKSQVRELAKYLGVPQKIIEKKPSPDIIPGIGDEYALGIDYQTLDLILLGLEKKLSFEEIARDIGTSIEKVLYVKNLTEKSAHMREIFVPKV